MSGEIPVIPAKTLMGRTRDTSWFGTDYNMNIYKGCCHGCIYCDSRSDCYRVENFDAVRAKDNALEVIRRDLKSKSKTGVIATGSMSDPYNPFEQTLRLTRGALEIISQQGFGVAIATKSDLIARDIDALQSIRSHAPVLCKLTVTAADDALCAKLEPHAPLTSRRFAAVKALSAAGLFTGILLMPVLPFLTDSWENISGIIHRARDCGARFVYPYFGVTLRMNQRDYYFARLDEHFPGMKVRYIRQYGDSYQCLSPQAEELQARFAEECRNCGLLTDMKEIIAGYRGAYEREQLTFF